MIVDESCIGGLEFFLLQDVLEIAQVLASRVVQRTKRWTRTALGIEIDRRSAQSNQSSEEGLFHIGILFKGHILDHRGELMMITDHNAPFLNDFVLLIGIVP